MRIHEQWMTTYLNFLQILENLDNILADHERVISIFRIQVVPLVAFRVRLQILLGSNSVLDLFFVQRLHVRHVR